MSKGVKTFRGLLCAALCLLTGACSSTQLNYNAADLASSLNSLQKRQIFFNLSQALTEPDFVPSQVAISIGTAQTANAITPTISIPLGPAAMATNRLSSGARMESQFTRQITNAAPALGVQMTDAWNQSWTMTPASSSNQIRRLRTLYQYATGTLPRSDPSRELTDDEAQRLFLCEYPMQAHGASAAPGGNVIYRLEGCQDNNTRAPRSRIIHADPTFTQGQNCIVCIDDLNAQKLNPHVNPNLKYRFLRTSVAKGETMVKIGSYGVMDFFTCASATGNCPLIPQQEPFDGRQAFSDFVLFIYEAMSVSGGTGGGARSTGGSFVYSVR